MHRALAASFVEPSGDTIVRSYSAGSDLGTAYLVLSGPLDGPYWEYYGGMVELYNEYIPGWIAADMVSWTGLRGDQIEVQSVSLSDLAGVAWRIIPPLTLKTVGGRQLAPLTGVFGPSA